MNSEETSPSPDENDPASPPADENEPIEKIDIPEPQGVFAGRWSFKKLPGLLAVFGPAAIVASVSIGAGETIVVVRAGSWAGYNLLWLVLLSCVVKGVFVTYLLGRYTAVSGEHIGHRLARLPGPRGWFLIMIIVMEMIGAPLAWVPISKPCGDLLHHALAGILPTSIEEPLWENIFTSCFIALALTVGAKISFERLEKQQIAICCILVTGTVIGTLMVLPNLKAAIIGSINFGRMPPFPAWAPEDAVKNPLLTMATTFGYVGGSVMGYIVYANWIGVHGWGMTGHKRIEAIQKHAFTHDEIDYLPDDPGEARRVRDLLAPLRWDAGMGAIVLLIVTAAFMISGAAVLYPMLEKGDIQEGFKGWSLLTDQAHVWSNIHGSLVWIYYVCIVVALWGTLQAFPEIYGRVMQEFFQAIWPNRTWEYRKIKTNVCIYIFVMTMIIVWTGVPFNILTQIAGFILANLAIALVMFAALYLNFKLPKAYRTRLPILLGGIVSAVILSIFAVISGSGLYVKLMALFG